MVSAIYLLMRSVALDRSTAIEPADKRKQQNEEEKRRTT